MKLVRLHKIVFVSVLLHLLADDLSQISRDILRMYCVFPFLCSIYRPLVYERVYLPLYKVADTPFHIQGDDILFIHLSDPYSLPLPFFPRSKFPERSIQLQIIHFIIYIANCILISFKT